MEARSLALLTLASPLLSAADFARDVRPVLAAKCQACHSARNASGGVDLSGDLSRWLIPGNAGGSLLYAIVSGEKPRMPKAGPALTVAEREAFRSWIDDGAKYGAAIEDTPWWSQRLLSKIAPPSPGGHPLDAFVRAKLREKGLTPSVAAPPQVLARRVKYDLHGLPPDAADLSDSYEVLVDRLLASPRYGERWARHWLDVVHYGDSHGYDKDKPRANAWRYRDWVIDALNADKPYARFVEEQIAGDVLAPDDAKSVIATGFIAAGPWDFVGHQELREGSSDKNLTRVLDRDDMVAATMSAFNSQTAHCARCHDHKFDPISQKDYYSLQAVFAGVDRAERPIDNGPALARQRRELWEKKRQTLLALRPLEDKAENASSPELDRLENSIRDAGLLLAHLGNPKTEAEKAEKDQLTARRAADTAARKLALDAFLGEAHLRETARLREALANVDASLKALPPPQSAYAAASVFDRMGNFRPALEPRPVHLLARGGVDAPQELMQAGSIGGLRFEGANGDGARRLALARWLTAEDNAFTWRSIVNRVWHFHFGAGLVDTPNDFGRMGSQPTHPELLDWLAVWFRDEAKGSLKALHRLILTSETYKQGSAHREDMAQVDSDNRYLWRMNRTRLDAEALRDSMLALSGKLDLTMGGPAVRHFYFKDDHSPVYDYARYDANDPGLYRRSVYRFIVRSVPDPFMDRLDCPDPSILTAKRNTTITAVQALTLLNNPFVLRMADEFAARWSTGDEAFRLALGRQASAREREIFDAHAAKFGKASAARLLFNMNEFVFVD